MLRRHSSGGFHWWGECWGRIGGGALELVERFLGISYHGDIQYARLIVPVQCDANVKTPCPTLCYSIFSWNGFMRCWASFLLWYMIPKSLTTRVNLIPLFFWHHNFNVIGAGSYPNERRYSLSAVCAMMPAWNIQYIPFSTLT